MVPLLTVAKMAAQGIAGYGAQKIVGNIVRNNVVVTTTVQRIVIGSGSFVLGSLAFEQSVHHIDRMIAEVVAQVEEIKQKKKEAEENKTEE